MKKNQSGKHKDHKERKLSRSNRSKFHRSYKKVEVMTIAEPGLSKVITYDKDGKVVSFNSNCKTKFEDTLTKKGKESMEANRLAKTQKKEAIKNILASAGFDPTIKYTRKEKKRFTRLVKAKLFVTPKPVTLSKEDCKKRFLVEKAHKAFLLESRTHRSVAEKKNTLLDFVQKRIQKGFTLSELTTKEKAEKRKFKYTIQRKSDEDPMKSVDFLTDYIEADSREDAKLRAKKLAKKYKKDSSFNGIRLQDSKDNNIIFYPKTTLLAA